MGGSRCCDPLQVCDVVIVGCGVAGLFTALSLPRGLDVVMLCKEGVEECDSMLAQGGVCVLRDEGDFDAFYEDTLRAGHRANRAESVRAMIRESRGVIDELIGFGVDFDREADGSLSYTREACHSRARICHCKDFTGREITERLRAAVLALPNVRIFEHTPMVDLLEEGGLCVGVLIELSDGQRTAIRSKRTVLATGGVGGLYDRSTNYPSLTGDGLDAARRHGVRLEGLDLVQFHPTSLWSKRRERAFLISESARGEGAVLLDRLGRRFADELQPRDVVTAAIREQMAKEGSEHVWLSFCDMRHVDVAERFPLIYQRCLEEGYDISREPIPVVPAQHYLMGGIWVDLASRTSMPALYAVGETSCNGVHGKNRLASNSLLESLVFARRAAQAIARCLG